MKAKNPKNPRGFSLIELLTVITIIVILAGMTVGALGWVQRKAAVDKARAQMALLENGLERYYADTGVYPDTKGDWDEEGLTLYYALFGDGVGADGIKGTADDGEVDGKPDEGATVYVPDLDPNTNSGLLEGSSGKAPTRVVDPFGNAWQYHGGGGGKSDRSNPDFDIYSEGPNGDGSPDRPDGDDIKNW